MFFFQGLIKTRKSIFIVTAGKSASELGKVQGRFPFVRTDLYRPAHSHRNEISLLSNNSNSFVIILVHISS